jgi:hypothetical protein
MTRHEATFDIDSPSDAHAAERILRALHDTVREESRNVREGSEDATELLAEFEQLRAATTPPAPGTLSVTYERHDGGFED